jgi:hypothetical protein
VFIVATNIELLQGGRWSLPDAMHSSVLHVGWSVRFAAIREQLILTAMNGLQIKKLLLRFQPPNLYLFPLYGSVSSVNNIFHFVPLITVIFSCIHLFWPFSPLFMLYYRLFLCLPIIVCFSYAHPLLSLSPVCTGYQHSLQRLFTIIHFSYDHLPFSGSTLPTTIFSLFTYYSPFTHCPVFFHYYQFPL